MSFCWPMIGSRRESRSYFSPNSGSCFADFFERDRLPAIPEDTPKIPFARDRPVLAIFSRVGNI